MKAPAKANLKKAGIVALVVAIAGIIIYYLMRGPKKQYTFDWAGGQTIAGAQKLGLHLPKGGKDLSIGQSITIQSSGKLDGMKTTIIAFGPDGFDAAGDKAFVVTDINPASVDYHNQSGTITG